jgi:hypothetical protein
MVNSSILESDRVQAVVERLLHCDGVCVCRSEEKRILNSPGTVNLFVVHRTATPVSHPARKNVPKSRFSFHSYPLLSLLPTPLGIS